jgi:hypothetical protein
MKPEFHYRTSLRESQEGVIGCGVEEKVQPSVSAIYWLLRALEKDAEEMTTDELLKASMLSRSSFFTGLREGRAAGLVRKRGNGYEAILLREEQKS